jgi:hypothetical protein
MGKSDENQNNMRAHKAAGESKHKHKQKNKPSFDGLTSSPFAMNFEDKDEGFRQSQWRDHFRQLCEYKIKFGHCIVPFKYSASPKLGVWVSKQRTIYRKNTKEMSTSMTAERIRALDGIGFDWGTSKAELVSIWNERFQQLCEFKARFGHYLVPVKYPANPKLGVWVSKQRYHGKTYQEGTPSPMTAERIRVLESVGFEWDTTAAFWSLRVRQLREFKVQFGHCLVPNKYSASTKLGQWVATQRTNYKMYHEGKPSPMTAERIQELESIGFEWEPNHVAWRLRFRQLREFKAEFGHCRVPTKYSENPTLGQWVSTQRHNFKLFQEGKSSRMTAERIQELERVGFEWETTTGMGFWSLQFRQLCEFKVQFGHCRVPQQYSANPKLRQWVSTQRHNFKLFQEGKSSRITAGRIRELESVGFEWEPNDFPLKVRSEQLREFKAQFGHCVMPQQYPAKPKLGQWASTQRSNCKLYPEGKPSSMTAERIRELESVEFISILPTPSSGSGFRSSATTASCIRKESQVP